MPAPAGVLSTDSTGSIAMLRARTPVPAPGWYRGGAIMGTPPGLTGPRRSFNVLLTRGDAERRTGGRPRGQAQTGCRTLLRPARGIPSGVSGLVVLCCLAGCLLGWVGFLSGFGSSGALDRGWDPGKVGGLLRMGQLVGPYCGSGGDRVKPGLDSPADPGKVEGLPRRSSVRLLRR
jgi:hypothetical protein